MRKLLIIAAAFGAMSVAACGKPAETKTEEAPAADAAAPAADAAAAPAADAAAAPAADAAAAPAADAAAAPAAAPAEEKKAE